MIKPPTYYRVLQVDPEADIQIIRFAYRWLAAKYHPENSDGTNDPDMFVKVREAWNMLSNEDRRLAYDIFIGIRSEPS